VERYKLADYQWGGVLVTNSVNIHALAIKHKTTLTIASGEITITQMYHVIAAESSTSDDLDTINLGYTNLTVKGNTYRPFLCIIADSGDTITLKHGTGNIDLPGDADVELSDDAFLWLLWDGTNWTAFAGSGSLNDAILTAPDSAERNTITPTDDTYHALRLAPHSASQSAALLEILTASGGVGAEVDEEGVLQVRLYGMVNKNSIVTGGVEDVTNSFLNLNAQSGTTDDLDTLNAVVGNSFVFLKAASGDTITIKHATDNIRTADGQDYDLSGDDVMLLVYDDLIWRQVNFLDGQKINADNITSGTLILEHGGTEADLSVTGGAGHVLKQASAGAAVTVGALTDSEIPNLPASKITSGQLATARGGTGADNSTGDANQLLARDGTDGNFVGTLDIEIDSANFYGPVAHAAASVTANTGTYNALSVVGTNTIIVDTSGGNVVLNGLANGVYGQLVHLVRGTTANQFIIANLNGSGTQQIVTRTEADITLNTRGRWTLWCDGSDWYADI